jgi:hypothetical protein
MRALEMRRLLLTIDDQDYRCIRESAVCSVTPGVASCMSLHELDLRVEG